jgi:hypothetical protein
MTFDELDRHFTELRLQHRAGTITTAEFEAQRNDLMAQDEQGRWWTKDADTGGWVYYDGASWIAGTPSASAPARPEPVPAIAPYQVPPPGSAVAPAASAAHVTSTGSGTVAVPGPGMGQGVAILVYVVAFFIPLVGWVLFFVNRGRPLEADRNVGKVAGLVATIGFVLWMLVSLA